MSLDISIKIKKTEKCPHCGGAIGGEVTEEIMTGGRHYCDMLDRLPYGDADYGKYKTLDKCQLEYVASEFDKAGDSINAGKIALAAINGSIVEFEADW